MNTATLTGGHTNLSDSADVTVTCRIVEVQQQAPPVADIAVVKTASPTVVTPGGNVTWTLVATNNGPDAADSAALVDNLPATLTLVSFTAPGGWDCSATVTGNPGKLSCTKPTMGVNESATFTLTTTVAAAAAGTDDQQHGRRLDHDERDHDRQQPGFRADHGPGRGVAAHGWPATWNRLRSRPASCSPGLLLAPRSSPSHRSITHRSRR